MAPLDAFRQTLAEAGIGPDKPLHAVLLEVKAAAQDVSAKVDELKALNVTQISRDVRRALAESVVPEFRLRWKWQRWAAVVSTVILYTVTVAWAAAFITYLMCR